MKSAHPLILVLSYSYLLLIKPDEERQSNWTKVSRDTLVSGGDPFILDNPIEQCVALGE
jgi:hypothetical protein